MRWYADNSELRGIWGAKIPDILLFGGIVVDNRSERELTAVVSDVKSAYRKAADFPLKWCFRDLKSTFRKRRLERLYIRLLQDSLTWREKIFSRIASIDFTVIIAAINCYGRDRATLLRTKSQVTRFAFVMGLQRYGLLVKDHNSGPAEVVLDWPAEGQRGLFDTEYWSALREGESAEYANKYKSGALIKLGFRDSVFFSSTIDCSLLQLSDLIVGATRDLVEEALEKKRDSIGASYLRLIKDRFRGAPNRVVGRGIALHPQTGEFFQKVSDKILSLYM
jgi:hypothetical protein